jgi:hypothetical protein
MPVCSNGHDSTWDDYCSECGVAIGGASVPAVAPDAGADVAVAANAADVGAAAPASAPDGSATPDSPAAPAAGGSASPTCPNCSEPYDTGDVFCENCGYDFLSGTLPDASQLQAASPAAAGSTPGAAIGTTIATVRFDRAYMRRMVEGDELSYSGAEDFAREIPLTGIKVLVGRLSRSRGVYPEIDVSEIIEDPAVSSRHCMLMRAGDGSWTVNDLGSTNGTYLGDATDPLQPGIETPLPLDTPIYVGAWTSITLSRDS